MNLFSLSTEVNKLHNCQISIEKSINPILEHLKKYPEYNLYELSNDLEKRRKNECNSVETLVQEVLQPLKYKMLLIKNKELGKITDFKQFKNEMVLIQDNIQNLKYDSKRQIESLETEVKDLSEDIMFYTEKLIKWTEPIQMNLLHTANLEKPKTTRTEHRCKEIKDFMDFVHSSGGHENGWRLEDHQMFIKFRKKLKDIELVAKHLHAELPDISIEDIQLHEEWYKKYCNLKMKKKKALKTWQKAKANKNVSERYAHVPARIKTTVQPSTNVKEKLMKWKVQKEEQTKNMEQIDICNKQKRDEMEQLRKKRNNELKLLVQEWKLKKQETEEQEFIKKQTLEEQEKKRRALQANKLIKEYQSQDDMFILKMKQKKKPQQFPIIRSKSCHSAKRDPKRLLKPTQQWINRVHDETPPEGYGKIIPLTSLPKLGIPEWRKKLV